MINERLFKNISPQCPWHNNGECTAQPYDAMLKHSYHGSAGLPDVDYFNYEECRIQGCAMAFFLNAIQLTIKGEAIL